MQGIDVFDMKPLDASRKGMGGDALTMSSPSDMPVCPLCGDCADNTDTWATSGTLDNPIVVRSFGDEQYAGCTGCPADSHVTIWLTVCAPLQNTQPFYIYLEHTLINPNVLWQMSRDRPIERCPECGNVLKMEYVGPPDEAHDEHGHGGHGEREFFPTPSLRLQSHTRCSRY